MAKLRGLTAFLPSEMHWRQTHLWDSVLSSTELGSLCYQESQSFSLLLAAISWPQGCTNILRLELSIMEGIWKNNSLKSQMFAYQGGFWADLYIPSCKMPVKEYCYFHPFLQNNCPEWGWGCKMKPNTLCILGLAQNNRNTEIELHYLSFSCLFSFHSHQHYPTTKDNPFFPVFIIGRACL